MNQVQKKLYKWIFDVPAVQSEFKRLLCFKKNILLRDEHKDLTLRLTKKEEKGESFYRLTVSARTDMPLKAKRFRNLMHQCILHRDKLEID